MSFPIDIERLITEYSNWLLKYIDKEQGLLSLPEINEAKIALESAEPKTIALRLKLISVCIYNPQRLSLIKQPVIFKFTDDNQIPRVRLESLENVRLNFGRDYSPLTLLKKATKIFVQNWIRCCKTADDWTAIQAAVHEIDPAIQNDIIVWTTRIENDRENLLKAFIPSNQGSTAGAFVGAATCAITGALITTIAEGREDAEQAQSHSALVFIVGGLFGGGLGYCLDNYHDTLTEYVYDPTYNLVSPYWKKLRGTGYSSQTEYSNTDVEMQQDILGELPTFPSVTGYGFLN
ncbi:MAG: hypothetical protein ABSF18_06190 [Gammaproteobacteria bacterium]|jgi:hypothetical protein